MKTAFPHTTCTNCALAVLAHLLMGVYVGIGLEKNACCFHTALCSRKMEWHLVLLDGTNSTLSDSKLFFANTEA
jgi:hypothetical protein